MKKTTFWLSTTPYIYLAMASLSTSANTESSAALKLNFDKYAIPYATFVINGNPVYAMVDTGSVFGFHLQELQLKKIKGLKKERIYRSTDAAGKMQENIEYRADNINMNGITLSNVTITPFKQWGMMLSDKGKLPNSPVVGLGAFKDKQILLDYVNNTLTISDKIDHDSLIKEGVNEYPFQMSADGMVFNVEQSGKKYKLIMDTGATVSMVWRERLKTHEPASCLLVNPDMDNKECEATRLTIKSQDGKPAQFGAVVIAGDFKHMGSIDGLIGNSFLRNRKILIDFKENKVFISNKYEK